MLKILDKHTPLFAGFLQSFFLTLYIFLIASVMISAENWFGSTEDTILAPLLFLTLFIFSAMISASLVLGYPFYTFWVKKNLDRAVKILGATGLFLIVYFILYIVLLANLG